MLNLNHLLAAGHCLGLHYLLGASLQISRALSLAAHALDCVHDGRLLCQECISQVGRPLDIASHPLNNVWKHYQ